MKLEWLGKMEGIFYDEGIMDSSIGNDGTAIEC